MTDQLGNVLGVLAQRRHPEGDDVEPVIQVLAEQALADQLLEVVVGGGDDPHVRPHGGTAADGRVLAFLEDAQQPGLGFRRHVPDLVEEQGAAPGLFETSDGARDGAGKGALFVAEQFALDEFPGDGRHVDGDEGAVAPLAVVMKGACRQFLAGARFAADHDRQIRRHDPGEDAVDVLHGRGAPDQRQLLLGRLLPWFLRPLTGGLLGIFEGAPHHTDKFVEVEGLGQVFEGAALGRLDRRQQGILGAHDDDAQCRADLADARYQIESVFVGHHHVGDDQIPFPVADPLPQGGRVAGRAHVEAGAAQGPVEHGADGAVVVGDENGRRRHHPLPVCVTMGSMTRNTVRRGWLVNSMTPP